MGQHASAVHVYYSNWYHNITVSRVNWSIIEYLGVSRFFWNDPSEPRNLSDCVKTVEAVAPAQLSHQEEATERTENLYQ